jgi:hypothetical protein
MMRAVAGRGWALASAPIVIGEKMIPGNTDQLEGGSLVLGELSAVQKGTPQRPAVREGPYGLDFVERKASG